MPLRLLLAAVTATTFHEPFSAARPEWLLAAGGPGRAELADGRLTLDLSTPRQAKYAFAELRQGFTLPARLEWDQCLAKDSPHVWFCGLAIRSVSAADAVHLEAGLGGSGLERRVFLGDRRSAEGTVEPGVPYHLTLNVNAATQVLTVARDGAEVARLESAYDLTRGPFLLVLFQNDPRLGPSFVDAYDQDRGASWFDNLTLDAASLGPITPPQPGTTYPYKIPTVFNRATRWITVADGLSGGAVAYESCGWMPLTGPRAVSRWLKLERWVIEDPGAFPPQPQIADAPDDTSTFTLAPGEKEATFALRALQWNLEQHAELQWRAEGRGLEWELELTATDGLQPFTQRLWQGGGPAGSFDAMAAYRASGRPNRYAEVDFLLHLRAQGDGPRTLSLRLGFPGRACVVPRSPVVVQTREADRDGAPIEAIVVDEAGRLLGPDEVRVEATVGGRHLTLHSVNGPVLRGTCRGLPPGDHAAQLVAARKGRPLATAECAVCVSALDYADRYDPETRSYATRDGRAVGPLLGDLIAWVPYVRWPEGRQAVVLGLEDLRRHETAGRSLQLIKWRSLPRADLDRYVQYLAANGASVVRLTPNVSVAEYYLDAGGHLAMHGFEQLSYVLAACRRDGVRAVVNLAHYPYLSPSTGNNPPVAQYFEAGYFRDFHWTAEPMWELLGEYLSEVTGYLGADPAVLAYTVTGENDQKMPVGWLNRAHDLIKSRAPHQLVVLEQGDGIAEAPEGDPANHAPFKPARDGGVGFRTYDTFRLPNDCAMAVTARFFSLARPSFWGEALCGVHTEPQFVTKFRDSLGLALTLQQPMLLHWSAPLLEPQRRVFTEASRRLDWSTFRRARPPVAIVVEKPDAAQIGRLVEYEAALSSVPVDYDYLRPTEDQVGYDRVFDARRNERPEPDMEALASLAPLRLSPGNHTTYALASDRRTMLAYIRNSGRYELLPCDIGTVIEQCRMPDQPRAVTIDLAGLAPCDCTLWDATTGAILQQGNLDPPGTLALRPTTSDLLLLVQPRR